MLACAPKLLLVLSFPLLTCGVAAARQMHLLSSYPAPETVIDGRNAQYVVRFDGPVDHHRAQLEIIRDGSVVQELHPRLESEPNVPVASAPALPPGRYVGWRDPLLGGGLMASDDRWRVPVQLLPERTKEEKAKLRITPPKAAASSHRGFVAARLCAEAKPRRERGRKSS
jgi:hypothetical protein